MNLPIFITNQFFSAKHSGGDDLVYFPANVDPFSPKISSQVIRELLEESLKKEDLNDFNPVITSIADESYNIESEYDFNELLDSIPFAVIIPEYYYPKAVNSLTRSAANKFLNCLKYGIEIPEDIKIQIDSIAIKLYISENIGKFLDQNQIIISTAGVEKSFRNEYLDAMVKALSDNLQIAGIWGILLDEKSSLMPNLVDAVENEILVDNFLEEYISETDAKLIIAPGVSEVEVGEGDNFETVEVSPDKINKFKIKEDDKAVFKWKVQKSKFEGEIYGSKTGIKIDVRERSK